MTQRPSRVDQRAAEAGTPAGGSSPRSAPGVAVRRATLLDLPGILEICNREIRENWAHFGTAEMTLEELRADFDGAQRGDNAARIRYPWVVADEHGAVAGYAKAGPWKDREAYGWTTEIGVYVRPASQGRGLGRALYTLLFPMMEGAGLRSILAGVALPNPVSVRLHEAFGMSHVGTLPSVGYKLGAWRSVGYWHRFMGDAQAGPPQMG